MTLTIGNSPFGSNPGFFNFERTGPKHVLYFEDCPRRVRVVFNGKDIADSTKMKLLHETGCLPVYYFPEDDIVAEFLESTDLNTHCPFKGDARYWSLRVGDQVAEKAVWNYQDPIDGAPPLAGYRAIEWNAMDEWYEEDERIYGHARDPYHRIDVVPSSRHVRIYVASELIADCKKPMLLFESSLPTRYYIPEQDVRTELLEPSESTSRCPYKGLATYRSVRAGGELHTDLVWIYEEPLHAVSQMAKHLCFYNEKVDIDLDGECLPRRKSVLV